MATDIGTDTATVVYDPFSAAFQDDPFPVYKRLRDEAPVHHSEEWDFWALSRFDDVRAAARDPETYLSFEGIDIDDTAKDMSAPGFLPDIDNPRHDRLRRIVQRTFIPRTIAKLEDDVRRVVTDLVDRFAGRGEADIAQELSWPIPYAVFFDLLGLPTTGSDRENLIRRSHGLKDREPDDPRLTPLAWDALHNTKDHLAEILMERRRDPREDLLTTLVTAEVEDFGGAPYAPQRITRDSEIVGLAFVLFMAGVESTSALLSTAFRELARHPDQRRALVADPAKIPAAVEEALRYDAPLQVAGRTSTRDVELHGVTIPAGKRVLLVYGAANRDDRQFDDPDRFDVFRPQKRHLSFSEGLHGCLGAPLARLEAKVALEVALPRLGDYEISGPLQRYRSTPNMHVLDHLPISFTPTRRSA
ncbi:cytochrome P450 [Pseudonocardia sp. H11422]|uniref:cytochrome P450 n=1 Tax=Pseudonocardia sp. H11422 TaxID=2835866 RepID=UPI001BDDC59F|nr:cytochrome P450 [Pseudonocardia sp. H11422]